MKLRDCLATLVVLLVALGVVCFSISTWAQSNNRHVGTRFTVTADPLVERPHTKPCVVSLFKGLTFAHFADTTQTFNFNPPDCTGPWQKVVLEVNFSENAGTQFDRTASIWIAAGPPSAQANANIYFGTTPEPLASDTNTWHVERDVTDYSSLFSGSPDAQLQGTMVLQNCTSDCGAPYNTLNGVFTVSADLEFYPAREHAEVPRPADVVVPLTQSNGGTGVNLPMFLNPGNPQQLVISNTLNLPTNVEQVYLDVIAQSQQVDEQWFACFPNDQLTLAQFSYGCGNTDFRETEVSIDGRPAGIAPVSPWVFTGFLPDQWQPIPAVQTLDFVPYRVNLTPFASILNDGSPHTISLSVFDNNYYFSMGSSLLLYLDHGSRQVTGELTKNTLTPPSPAVVENLQGTTDVTGKIEVNSNREFIVAGYVNTSHGKVTTTISERRNFSGVQAINFNTATGAVEQNTSVKNSVVSSTTVVSGAAVKQTASKYSFPITVDLVLPVANSLFGLTVTTAQNYQASRLVEKNGAIAEYSTVSNSAAATDTLPVSSSQEYTDFDLTHGAYSCKITSANSLLTSVSAGCGQ
jgi:Peptide N-acetyl-beta-D-glucosaminyl asparaginase amidase A